MAVLVELEDLGVGPDVGAVVADKDGDITQDADVACLRSSRAERTTAR